MKILVVLGRNAYSNTAQGVAYEHANIRPDLASLATETRPFDCWDRSTCANFEELNSVLLRTVADFNLGIIFMVLLGVRSRPKHSI